MTDLKTTTQTVVSHLLWDEDNWKHLLESSPAANEWDGDAFLQEWEMRDKPSSPFNNHIVTDALLLYEQVFGETATSFIHQQAREQGFLFSNDIDE